jgi:DNA-directed RNA polymerase specialized sigma24 family protein
MSAAVAENARPRSDALAAFYASHHHAVMGAVRSRVHALSDAIVEDACAFAWLSLVRRDDVSLGRHGLNWLITVAVRDAWARGRRQLAERPSGALSCEPAAGECGEPPAAWGEPLERVIAIEAHDERLRRFRDAKPLERRELFLHAAGFRYAELAEATGSTYTAVNRRLTEGRRRLRAAA